MEICNPAPTQRPALRALWQEAFGDSDTFLDSFFSTSFCPNRCRCILSDDQIAAALYWFDCSLGGEKYAYLYAVATAKSFQRKGLCRRLLEDTHALLAREGYAGALLVPESEGLRRMYTGFGYRRQTQITEFSCRAEGPAACLRSVCPEAYAQYRRQYLPEGGVIQEGAGLAFLNATAKLYLGPDFLLAAQPGGDGLRAVELLGNREAAPGILRALGYDRGVFRVPGNGMSFAMFLPLRSGTRGPDYFGLAFD